MKKYVLTGIISCIVFGCQQCSTTATKLSAYETIVNDDYELYQPIDTPSEAVLILFGGFPEGPADIRREFDIITPAQSRNISVLLMNYHQKLWLSGVEKEALKNQLETIFATHQLPTDQVSIGGFSSGGNVTLLISDFLMATKSSIQPKGIFVVDSPVDLLELYRNSKRNLARDFSKGSTQEAAWLVGYFENIFGDPAEHMDIYQARSPYTAESNNVQNLTHLDDLKIRFYTEPDTAWWKESRGNTFTDLNAYWIKKLAAQLKQELPRSKVEFITTSNKGYRADGSRHPHSWSIVDTDGLMKWMLSE